ncbi:prolyl oligopeptidase family serine peptidase [Rhizobium sp. LC145]|uniref:alpha/beta hydrolase family protein n=1 Tax=Rhizobium sp. LC145 TaxID=1120688 RepID=UPI000629E8A0|nr:prolyl oligopeptidase family serine peptidase [Rhizobium sp. LC145]KKX33012.1 hypothetical protein YH62_05560 [Rhizobium sp. LC145]TKT55950.1 alpha/beta hydrolase [Rhizobiaceae bacterium LC148]
MRGVRNALKLFINYCWRLLRWQVIKYLFLFFGIPSPASITLADQPRLGPFEQSAPKQLSVPVGSEPFDAEEVLYGAVSSPDQCAQVPDGMWIEVDGKGECIRYYGHGFSSNGTPLVLVYFSGDVMLRTPKGERYVGSSYADRSPAVITDEMAQWSTEAGTPTIFLARPGIYGSSGDHNQRRHSREIDLMNAAMDRLKERYGVSSFVLTGHSAGGQIVAALLNKRADLHAAVMSSPLASVKQVAAFWENRRDIPGRFLYDVEAFYDPVEEIDRIKTEPSPRIYVISDPEDRTVPFYSQLYYVRRLRASGLKPQHIYAQAADPAHHLLAEHAKRAATLIARDQPDAVVRRALVELDLLSLSK